MDRVEFNNFVVNKGLEKRITYTIAILSDYHIASAIKHYLKTRLKTPCAINFLYVDKPKSLIKQP